MGVPGGVGFRGPGGSGGPPNWVWGCPGTGKYQFLDFGGVQNLRLNIFGVVLRFLLPFLVRIVNYRRTGQLIFMDSRDADGKVKVKGQLVVIVLDLLTRWKGFFYRSIATI